MKWLRRITVAMAMLWALPVSADSWAPPRKETYRSADGNVRFTVVPRGLQDQLAYFTDKVKGREPAGQRRGAASYARGLWERRSGTTWTRIWEGRLVNDVSPVSALVADDGRYVVTFDNWHSMGFGDNVVVIYRTDGTVVRSLKLADIMPEDYVRILPRSVSSLWWSGKHSLSPDGRSVILKIVIPGSSDGGTEPRGYLDVPVELATGTVTPLAGPNWDMAQAVAAPLIASAKESEAENRARTLAPLKAPTGTAEMEWTRYMHEAAERLASPPGVAMGLGTDWVLPAPGDPQFAENAELIRSLFTEPSEKQDYQFSSPSAPDALAHLLIDSASHGRPGSLAGSRLFIALPASQAEPVRTALKRSGATVILFDPVQPIQQRPEVLRQLGVAPDQVDTEVAKAEAAARQYKAEAARLKALAPPEPAVAKPQEDDAQLDALADAMEMEAAKLEKGN
ncbi:hypothetical protein ACQR50_15480 [Sphingomonas sp. Xoc002]|uniref:hypothetical protein n=1 Tax=Sphingomonas sp. Xoc002 TaxID=2837624 RepID=UPI003D165DCD